MCASGSVCGRALTGARAYRCFCPRAYVCAHTHPSARARTRLRSRAPVCAHCHPSALAVTCLRVPLPVCARCHPSARAVTRLPQPLASVRALRQRGSRFDTLVSLKLPTVKKKMVKKILHADVRLKRTNGQVCPSVRPRPKPTSKPPCSSS